MYFCFSEKRMAYFRIMILRMHSTRLTISTFYFFLALTGTSIPAFTQIIPDTSSKEQEAPVREFPEDTLNRRTPRGTVNGFIKAVAEQNFTRAGRYLNLDPSMSGEKDTEELVQVLQRLLDRGGQIMPYSWISTDPAGRTDDELPPELDRVGTVTIEGESVDLYVEETTGPEGGPIWLFSAETMERIAAADIEQDLVVEQILPDYFQETTWSGIPVGHWLLMVLLILPAYFAAWIIIRGIKYIIRLFWAKARTEPTAGIIYAFALPIRIYLAVWLFIILTQQLGISILLRQRLSGVTIIIGLVAVLILLWRLTDYMSIFGKRQMSMRGKASMVSVILFLRRVIKIAIVVFGIIAILGAIGVDVTTGLAALGIGGIALALGAQKTVENFVGSVTLVADQPVRVGDFCKVGDTVGTVESIGMRSTRIRTNDRTIVTIPNGEFSSTRIENYAHRDRFLIHKVIGVRYETTPDQIRYLLVELRSILYSHPLVDPNPARIRFLGFGDSSLDLEIFAFINANGFDQYLEVKEDLYLRMMDVIAASGTDFAFPSQTLYFAKDGGVSEEKTREAEERVRQWRANEELQIPKFDAERIQEIKNAIDYPPTGSSENKKK